MNILLCKIQEIKNKVIEHVVERVFHVDFIPRPVIVRIVGLWSGPDTDYCLTSKWRKKFWTIPIQQNQRLILNIKIVLNPSPNLLLKSMMALTFAYYTLSNKLKHETCPTVIRYPIINATQNKRKRKTTLLLTLLLAIAATVFSQTNRISGGIVAGANYTYLNTSEK